MTKLQNTDTEAGVYRDTTMRPGGVGMRLRVYAILCVLTLGSAWAQEATASAYDILGVAPLSTAEAPEQEEEQTPVILTEAPLTEDEEQPAAEPVPELEEADSSAEAETEVADDSLMPEISEVSDVVEDDDGTTPYVEAEPAEPLAEPEVDVPAEPDAEEAGSEAGDDEDVLMAEIMRLLAERDSLYEDINELEAENQALALAAAEADGFKIRVAELEAELVKLEATIAEKEAALAEADTRLAEAMTKLEGETTLRAEAEARLGAAGGDQAAFDELLAERDAALAEKDAAITEKDSRIA
ncbi:MAG: hypothetical protein JXM71_11690, partial [Spirochaetales bacterium]|nr:hypothetical protein [Spirochaetales bacterium]